MSFTQLEDVFSYHPKYPNDRNSMDWWLNFADEVLFVAFTGPLFAQDEMQVAEHPVLAHLAVKLREAADEGDKTEVFPRTREDGCPTPVLISGIERRVHVKVDCNPSEFRPNGLYGSNFASASRETIERACVPIHPPTITNMICMAALGHGQGLYTKQQIVDLFTTAYTSFKAAVLESTKNRDSDLVKVVVHTGNWGTGAFGGSKPLIAILQCAAAACAGVDELVYHTFSEEGTVGYNVGFKKYQQLKGGDTSQFLEDVLRLEYSWGVSDGN